MLTQRFVTIYGIVGLLVMVILLALIGFKQVPESLSIPFFGIAIVLFIGRLVLRYLLIRKERAAKLVEQPPTGQEH